MKSTSASEPPAERADRAGQAAIPGAGSLASALLLLGAAYSAILLTGAREQGSLGLFLIVAGAVLIVFRPQVQLGWRLWACAGAFLGAAASSLLPLAWSTPPAWRQRWQEAAEIPVSDTITPVLLETGWWWSLLAVSVCLALFMLSRPLHPRAQLALANAAMLLTAGYAALAIFSEITGWRFPFDVQPTFGFFRNRNHTASFLVMGSVLALGVLGLPRHCGHSTSRWLAGAGLAVCAAALIFFSISRAGIVFLGLGTLLWLLGVHRGQARALPIAGVLLAGLLLVVVSGGAARQRLLGLVGLEEGVRAGSNAQPEAPADFRILIFQDTWQIIQDHPWTGTGLGTFAAIFPQYQQASLRMATAAHPESDWLMLAAEAGLPSVALLALLAAVACWPLRTMRSELFWPLRWGLFCAAAVAVLHGAVDVPAHRVPLGWWMLLLAAASLGQEGGPRARWPQRVIFIVAGCGALYLGCTLVRAAWFKGSPSAPFAGKTAQEGVARQGSEGRMEEAIAMVEAGIDRNPLSDGLYYQLGCLLLEAGDPPEDVDRLFAAQRLLQPKWPEISIRQGAAWSASDAPRTVALWQDALARQAAIDARTGGSDAAGAYRQMLGQAADKPAIIRGLLSTEADRTFLWLWLDLAPVEILNPGLQDLAVDGKFLQRLTSRDREHFIQLWAKRGSPDALRQFLAKSAGWEAAAWPLLLREALNGKEMEQAVRLVCKRFEISLDLPARAPARERPGAASTPLETDFERLWKAGREITARARLAEAAAGPSVPAEVHRWQAALAARDGVWPAAWGHLHNYLRATHREVW